MTRTRPDWKHWLPTQVVELWEAVMLSCDEDPEHLEPEEDDGLPGVAGNEAARRLRVAIDDDELPAIRNSAAPYCHRWRVTLAEFAAWARERQRWKLPGPLLDAAIEHEKLAAEERRIEEERARQRAAEEELLKQPAPALDSTSSTSTAISRGMPGGTKAEGECEAWLVELRRAGPQERSKDEYFAEAEGKIANLSRRGFESAWRAAATAFPNKQWSRPGKKPKKS